MRLSSCLICVVGSSDTMPIAGRMSSYESSLVNLSARTTAVTYHRYTSSAVAGGSSGRCACRFCSCCRKRTRYTSPMMSESTPTYCDIFVTTVVPVDRRVHRSDPGVRGAPPPLPGAPSTESAATTRSR
jgi:hypothetical protein